MIVDPSRAFWELGYEQYMKQKQDRLHVGRGQVTTALLEGKRRGGPELTVR